MLFDEVLQDENPGSFSGGGRSRWETMVFMEKHAWDT
jgi:hypothetical protein